MSRPLPRDADPSSAVCSCHGLQGGRPSASRRPPRLLPTCAPGALEQGQRVSISSTQEVPWRAPRPRHHSPTSRLRLSRTLRAPGPLRHTPPATRPGQASLRGIHTLRAQQPRSEGPLPPCCVLRLTACPRGTTALSRAQSAATRAVNSPGVS